MKPDKSIDSQHERINKIESLEKNSNGDDTFRIDKYDDEYYLDQNRDPKRFLLYRQARAEKWQASGPHGPSDYDKTISQDELDYRLKERLRVPPEQRYQHEKQHYYFHELYVEGGEECNPMRNGCTPNCRFYPEHGEITDEEVREEYKKLGESLRRDNKIVEPPTDSELQRLAKVFDHI